MNLTTESLSHCSSQQAPHGRTEHTDGPPHIFRLPTELLHEIFARLSPEDFLACRQSCSRLLHASECRLLMAEVCSRFARGNSLDEMKKLLFHHVTTSLSPFEKYRRGLGEFYRSTTTLHVQCRSGLQPPPILRADGDGTYFAVSFERVVHIFVTMPLRLGVPSTTLAKPPARVYSHLIGSPVVGFYASRAPKVRRKPERFLFLLTHKNHTATVISGAVGFMDPQHTVLKNPLSNKQKSPKPRRPEILGAIVNAEKSRLAILGPGMVAVYNISGIFRKVSTMQATCAALERISNVTNIMFAGHFGDKVLLEGSKTLVLPLVGVGTSATHTLKCDPVVISSIPPKILSHANMTTELRNSLTVSPVLVSSCGVLRIAIFCATGGRHSPGGAKQMIPLHGAQLLHPNSTTSGKAAEVVDYASVLVGVKRGENHYLIAVRYSDGQIWLFEYCLKHFGLVDIANQNLSLDRQPDLHGVFLGHEDGVLSMDFAIRWIDSEQNWNGVSSLVALVLVLEGNVIVTRQLSVLRGWKSAAVSVKEEQTRGSGGRWRGLLWGWEF